MANLHFDIIYLKDSKEISKMCSFPYAAMSMMTSKILQFVDLTTTQKSKYLKNKTFFLQIKKFINYTSRTTLWQKIYTFVAEATFQ